MITVEQECVIDGLHDLEVYMEMAENKAVVEQFCPGAVLTVKADRFDLLRFGGWKVITFEGRELSARWYTEPYAWKCAADKVRRDNLFIPWCLWEAIDTMARCNGAVNRTQPIQTIYQRVRKFLAKREYRQGTLDNYSSFFVRLTPEARETAVDGEHEERAVIMRHAPYGLDQLLNDVFDIL